MILNTTYNGKIIKPALNISLADFTVITGENGSGKTQLLKFICDYSNGFGDHNENGDFIDHNGNYEIHTHPLLSDSCQPLTEIVYSYPGLRNQIEGDNDSSKTLMEYIKQQWDILEPIVVAYRSIKHKKFSDEVEELKELQLALTRFVGNAVQATTPTFPVMTKQIDIGQLQQLKKLALDTGKDIDNLYLLDYIIFYPIPLGLFSSAIDLLFHQYFLKETHFPYLTRGVISPLRVFNEILDRASFKYKADYKPSNIVEIAHPVKLVDRKTGKEVHFHDLSSGETTIMALIFALYNSENKGLFPQAILFDEPDAHLHPSLTQIFLDVIQDVLIKEQNVKVILTTHSPSTVALASEESIYCMDRDLGFPIKESKKNVINLLSSGLAAVTIQESNLGIVYNIKNANANILFTEGITDKIILETVWDKLYPGKRRYFYIQDCFSANFLGALFNQGDQSPDGIFHQFNDKKMIALFDFDQAGYGNWNRSKFQNHVELDPRKGLVRHNGLNGYLMLLPVPDIPEISGQVISSGNETFKEQSYLTIESLIYNNEYVRSFFKKISLPGGGAAHVINGDSNKRKLSESLFSLTADDFVYFIPLFEKVMAIFRE